ncbi:hypothetical protein ACVWVY_000384 [Bradyrhizobium sp. URHC0002]
MTIAEIRKLVREMEAQLAAQLGKKAPEEEPKEKPSRTDQARQVAEEYASDQRGIVEKLRTRLNWVAAGDTGSSMSWRRSAVGGLPKPVQGPFSRSGHKSVLSQWP